MRAAVLREVGGPEVLRIEDIETPTPGPGEVLMKVHAVSINQTLDILVRSGESYAVEFPFVLGNDPSGVVEEVGDGVQGFKKGDHVTAVKLPLEGGGYAEYTLVSAKRTDHIPKNVSFADASFMSRHFPMAYSLARAADLKADEWVLVMGAAGGLGYAAVQVAKHLGARAVAAAGTDERVATAVEAGAEAGINYRAQDLAEEVMRITGEGVNVVYENIADPTLWPGAFNSLAMHGRLVTVG
ncbi:MAG: zinc-binding alcohol dehydrogenase family protein, partial [Dehalococcoidia bacterium]